MDISSSNTDSAEIIPFPERSAHSYSHAPEHAPLALAENADLYISQEQLYFNSKEYFDALYDSIERAERSICMEMYIWSDDEVGDAIFSRLRRAVERGVKVKVLVDGFGSFFWTIRKPAIFEAAGIEVRIYKPLIWKWSALAFTPWKISRFLARMNHRNHKKLVLIDNEVAFTGSLNVTRMSLEKKECGIRLAGEETVSLLTELFEDTWEQTESHLRPFRMKNFTLQKKLLRSKVVRSNQFYFLRRANIADLRHRISLSRNRIWMMTPYFVPPIGLLRSLLRAANRGVDVRIILPYRTDVWFLRWISATYYRFLLKGGVKVYEYTPQILHAKEMVIDGWALVGSSNLNRRSSYLDLELDIALNSEQSVWDLEMQFEDDFRRCSEITTYKPLNSFKKYISRKILFWRHWC